MYAVAGMLERWMLEGLFASGRGEGGEFYYSASLVAHQQSNFVICTITLYLPKMCYFTNSINRKNCQIHELKIISDDDDSIYLCNYNRANKLPALSYPQSSSVPQQST